MSNVSFRNTDFVNNPIGNDRPIYGNEFIPPPTPSPSPVYYYYEVQSCSGPFIGWIRSTSVLSIGQVFYSPTEGCIEVFSTATTETDLTDYTTEYASCAACETAYPTPTPSITPTQTQTPTPTLTPTLTPSNTPNLSPTPTPSITPSGYIYVYETANCLDGTNIKYFATNSLLGLGSVVQGFELGGCWEVLGSSINPYNDVVQSTYPDCGSCR